MTRPRAGAATLDKARRLMVYVQSLRERHWTLPGGRLYGHENLKPAAVQEAKEETGLNATINQLLFKEEYELVLSSGYVAELPPRDLPSLGCDPQQSPLAGERQLLQSVAGRGLKEKLDEPQVSSFISIPGTKL
jgi:8-oxo-dGTP pyrophosphatase MutT (NUDIX family)